MLFHSYEFIFAFLPLVVLVCALGRGHPTALRVFLVAASLFFYGWWSWNSLYLIGFSILFNYACGTRLASLTGGRRRGLLWFGLAVNLGLLAFFKYRAFLVNAAASLAGRDWQLEPPDLPLAISFFTFQQITYLVDVYRAQAPPQTFLLYCLFVTFFPHLIAGPILQHRKAIPMFSAPDAFRLEPYNVARGLFVFAIGLFKKVVLADTFGPWATRVFDAAVTPSFSDAWGGVLAFALQVYFDFSGYSDMAVGLGLLLNVKLPENFDSPYKARSIIDFWRRWNMTLAAFLRDYLYIPLGGNRGGLPRRYVNILITMLLGGLWHGARGGFVLWGGLNGVFLVVNHEWQRRGFRLPAVPAWGLTFAAVLVGYVFVRADTLGRAGVMLSSLFGANGFAYHGSAWALGNGEFKRLAAGLAIVLWCPNRQAIVQWPWASDLAYAVAFALLFGASLITLADPVPFYYFRF